jgi:Protein of unknown function (DUF3579)
MQHPSNYYVIQGITKAGRTFRPSDWAERLCGVLGSFDADERLRYADDVQPTLIEGVRCVVIGARLTASNPDGFRFLLEFARDNDLRVLPPADMAPAAAPVTSMEPASRMLASA